MNGRSLYWHKVHVTFISADISGALQVFASRKIVIENAVYEDRFRLSFAIDKKSLPMLQSLVEKRGDTLVIRKHEGFGQVISAFFHRPVLLIGLIFAIFLSCWIPNRVFFVRVEGNCTIPANRIIVQAEQCGISFGVQRRIVRSEQMKNALLQSVPEIQWAGINTYGCTAVITVRERNEAKASESNNVLSSIVAAQDAVVREIVVQKGNALCQVGQVVRKGQTLVSAYTDCGRYIRVTGAQGEIFGDTQHKLTVISPTEYCLRTTVSGVGEKYSLILGKKRINFYKGSGISGGSCAKIYTEKCVTLPGGFTLPIRIVCEQQFEYDTTSELLETTESVLLQFAESYLLRRMQMGRILQANYVYFQGEGFYRLDGIYSCYEMIGTIRPEEANRK